MEYRRVGSSGLEVSAIGLGCTNFGVRCDAAQTKTVIDAAIDRGINLIDTANTYSAGKSEEHVGRALEGRRSRVVLTSKFGQPTGEGPMQAGGSRQHVMAAVEASLRRLRTDYIDLYQMHVPDPRVPIEETLRALDDLVRQGKVRYLGSSCFEAWQLCEALWTSRSCGLERFVSTQCHYSLLTRDVEHHLMPLCAAYGVGLLPFFSLESGLLTGKYAAGGASPPESRAARYPQAFFGDRSARSFEIIEKLQAFASERGRTLTELALAALLPRPAVASIVVGAMSVGQLDGSLRALDWRMSRDEMDEVDRLAPSPEPRWLRFLSQAPVPTRPG